MVPVPDDLPEMEYRYLGPSGLQVSAISLGGWLTYGGHVENENTFACMKAAYDAGINFFDCAEGYAGGESERVMGEAIKKFGWKRNDIVISTKIYWGQANGEKIVNNIGLSRKRIIEGTHLALERLQLDYVDLIYAHRPDRACPMEETVRAFNHLINTGKAFYWGTSEWTAAEIASAHAVAHRLNLIAPIMEQPEYNLLSRAKVEGEFLPLYNEFGLGLTTFSPLKFGFLTGKYNTGIPSDSRLGTSSDNFAARTKARTGDESWKADIAAVEKLMPVAERLGISMANLAMSWVLKNERVSSAITGASKPEQVFESVRALRIREKLTPEIMAEIDEILGNKPEALTKRYV
ncbi:putative voltage-gated K channel beta subunit [Sclerotinia borealis F-4128]|uniref:Putative voltage-gated K channel beta subunit n=1 Tax=Sclerotinia borealis (strain F-4128) TaxID=1432307 RepID=W9CID4_SCLBF|nr:putative voltage-gated K channel beta subunit [Sclerotinia borealis F-4128]